MATILKISVLHVCQPCQFLAFIHIKGLQAATINRRISTLSSFFEFLIGESDDGSLRNPVYWKRHSVRSSHRLPRDVSDETVSRLLNSLTDSRDRAMFILMVSAGLRVNELLRLELGDLEISPRSGKLVVREGKHGGSRTVPLVVEVRKTITAYLQTEHPVAAERLSDPVDFDNLNRVLAGTPHKSLWHGERGPLVARNAIRRILDKYALAARIGSFGPHVLRRMFSYCFLQENPGKLRELAAILGHKNLQTVMIYTEPHLEDLAEQMECASRGNGS